MSKDYLLKISIKITSIMLDFESEHITEEETLTSLEKQKKLLDDTIWESDVQIYADFQKSILIKFIEKINGRRNNHKQQSF